MQFELTDDAQKGIWSASSVLWNMLGFMPEEVFVLPGLTDLPEVVVEIGRPKVRRTVRLVVREDLDIEPGTFKVNVVLGPMLQREIVGDFLTAARLAVQAIFIFVDFVPREVYVRPGTTEIKSFEVHVGRSLAEMVPHTVKVIERVRGLIPGHMMFSDPDQVSEAPDYRGEIAWEE